MSDEAKRQLLRTTLFAVDILFGVKGLYVAGAMLSFDVGLASMEAALEAFWPQYSNVDWIRLAGGFVALSVFLWVLKWRSHWSWRQLLVGIALYPVIVLLWVFGTIWMIDPRPNPILRSCLSLIPVFAFVAIVSILGRRFWLKRQHREINSRAESRTR